MKSTLQNAKLAHYPNLSEVVPAAYHSMLFAAQMLEGLVYYGYAGIIVYMILTGCGLPMPEEVAIIAGGALAASGQLHWGLTLGALLIGALLGDIVMYCIGYHFGRKILKSNRLWTGYLTPQREQRVEKLLSRHGAKVLFFARFLVGLRGPIYITAGILRMPFRKFVLADLVSATVVVSLFFGLSYYYGQTIVRIVHEGEGVLTLVVITVAVIAAGAFLWFQLRRKRMPGLEVLAEAQAAVTNGAGPSADANATEPPVSTTTAGELREGSSQRESETKAV